MEFKYLSGLNTLRFIAAFFVIISHASISTFYQFDKDSIACLNRGGDAVEFFFVLSGFLITYLLMQEIKKTSDVSIRNFYLRRVYRIWPLYFIIVGIGFFIFTVIFPRVYHQNYFTFPLIDGFLCFAFFIPNYITSNYSAGLLHPLWSIGVEEQFYLFWAPLVKAFKKHLLWMILSFVLTSTVFYFLIYNQSIVLNESLTAFFLTQRFYAMAIGSFYAYILYYHYDWYVNSILTSKITQFVVVAILIIHYTMRFDFSHEFYFHLFITCLYGLLILNVSVIKNKLIDMEKKPFVYLGVISYGLYMYHMLIDYVLRLIFPRLVAYSVPILVLIPLYYILLLGFTVLIAAFSFRYIEGFFLRFKKHQRA
jgi:peptidoglycan/LPS O-acetylase OafA/YrhL